MREIKFRAWDGEHMINVCTLEMMKSTNGLFVGASEGYWGTNNRKEFSLSDVQLMQFTGLKDKSGKEIYEGDIVRCVEAYSKSEYAFPVVWQEDSASFRYGVYSAGNLVDTESLLNYDDAEIIGNIYENPELLK